MNKKQCLLVVAFFALISLVGCTSSSDKYATKTATDANGYTYEYVENDPAGARIYTLENGLKIYLSVNEDKPRIQTLIAVRAGSKDDPRENTGQAHYFEHMMFKGSSSLGTKDWEKERVLIQQISDLFELRCQTTDEAERTRIYAQIDSLSQIASQYAIANEYDKVCSMIGATGTNAWTSYDETVYVNEIPSNEIERWALTESDRFNNLVLRLFHTELETVFEEFNMGQDSDNRRMFSTTMANMFPKHPYGISVIGKGEHLKNPSMESIVKFKNDFYVPNNMAVCMSGDLDFEATVKIIDQYFGSMKANENLPKTVCEVEEPITATSEIEVSGPERESVTVAFRTEGNKSKQADYLTMISAILSNGQAGLMDLNLTKKQEVMYAYANAMALNDYGLFMLGGAPREGQTLEQVKDLLLAELDKVKKGEFEEWLLEAIVNEAKLSQIEAIDGNYVAYGFVDAFIANKEWADVVSAHDEMAKITKEEIVAFANEFFTDNYLVTYKRMGVADDVMHMEKPVITALTIDRNSQSKFVEELAAIKVSEIQPVFVDYKAKIKTTELAKGLELNYIKNEKNDIATLYYIIKMDKKNNKLLPIALDYMEYLGTETKTIDDLSKEWYRLGVNYSIGTGSDLCYVVVSGLDENLNEAAKLMEEVMKSYKPDQDVYNEYVNGILKNRDNAKLNKNSILWGGLMNYSKYGEKSSFTDIISEEELKAIDPKTLTDLVAGLFNYEHLSFYYGPREESGVAELIKTTHNVTGEYSPIPEATVYPELEYTEPEILFVNFDMVQTMIGISSKDTKFDASIIPATTMFNEYYGGSMSSIVFQEIREAKGLAYSCFAAYNQARDLEHSNYITGFLSTQPDKMKEALDALTGLLNTMTASDVAFNNSKEAIIKKMNTERIIKDDIFWNYLSLQKIGLENDPRETTYAAVENMTMNDIQAFFDNRVKGKHYDILVIGDRNKIDFNLLKNYGNVKELTLEQVFNY